MKILTQKSRLFSLDLFFFSSNYSPPPSPRSAQGSASSPLPALSEEGLPSSHLRLTTFNTPGGAVHGGHAPAHHPQGFGRAPGGGGLEPRGRTPRSRASPETRGWFEICRCYHRARLVSAISDQAVAAWRDALVVDGRSPPPRWTTNCSLLLASMAREGGRKGGKRGRRVVAGCLDVG